MAEDLTKIEAVDKFLHDPVIYTYLDSIAEKYEIKAARVDEFLDLTDAIFDRTIKIAEMPGLLELSFGLTPEEAIEVARDIVGYRLLPLENYLPHVSKQIIAWGGNLDNYPKFKVGRETATVEIIINRISAKNGVELPHYLNSRLAHLAKAYLEKERAKEPTITLMMRPSNIGGLGLSATAANNILRELESELVVLEDFNSELDIPEVVATMQATNTQKTLVEKTKKEEERQEREAEEKDQNEATELIIPEELPVQVSTHIDDLDVFNRSDLKKMVADLEDEPEFEALDLSQIKTNDNDENLTPEDLASLVEQLETEFADEVLVDEPKGVEVENFEAHNLPVVLGTHELAKEVAVISGHVVNGIKHIGVHTEKLTPFNGQEIKEDLKAHNMPVLSVTRAMADQVPVISGKMFEKHEEEDLKLAAEKNRKARIKLGAEDKTATQAEVNETLQKLIPIFRKKRLNQQVFKEVAQSHVKGLREVLSTEILLREKYKFTDAEVAEIMPVLETARKLANGEHTPLRDRAPGEIPTTASKTAEIMAKESELLNKRHATVTNRVSDARIEPVSLAQVSAARTKEEELALQEKLIDAEKLKQAEIASKPKKAVTKLSMASVPPDKKTGGKFTDVKFQKRLLGPVEEIASLTAVEFRRLSSDPNEAVHKLLDKLELLEKIAYEERIKGVKAWRLSGVNKLYILMTEEALANGLSIAEVAARRRNAGEDSLSPKEVNAIVKMNKAIKF